MRTNTSVGDARHEFLEFLESLEPLESLEAKGPKDQRTGDEMTCDITLIPLL
jgi:hypothetical protein